MLVLFLFIILILNFIMCWLTISIVAIFSTANFVTLVLAKSTISYIVFQLRSSALWHSCNTLTAVVSGRSGLVVVNAARIIVIIKI